MESPSGCSSSSILSKEHKSPFFQDGDNFTADRINQAFQSLFGAPKNNGEMLATPCFYDNPMNLKVKPGMLFNNESEEKPKKKSVFSPIPCQPQSAVSILGVRGDTSSPYTPYVNQASKLSPLTTRSHLKMQ